MGSPDDSSPRRASNGSSGLLSPLQSFIGRLTPGQRNLLLVVCLIFLAYPIFGLAQAYLRTHNWVAVAWSLPRIILWCALVAVPTYYLLAWRAVREFTVVASQTVLRLGEEVEAAIRLTLSKPTELQDLAVRLVSNESARGRVRESDRDRDTTWSHDRVEVEQLLTEHQPLEADAPQEWRARLRVPSHAMHSFSFGPCSFTWRLQARASSAHFPDLVTERPITVLAEEARNDST